MRGQANLPALAVALLVVTTVAGLSLTLADTAFMSADRDATEQATADTVAERLIATDSPVTERRNVLNASRLDDEHVASVVPPERDIRVSVGERVVYERGDPAGGSTANRITLVAERQTVTLDPPLDFGSVTLPRRSPRATLSIDQNASIETVRANERVVLHDPSGVVGEHEIEISRYETTTLQFEGAVDSDDVELTYYPRRTQKAILEVTVGE